MNFLYRLAFILSQIHYRLFYRVRIHGRKKELPEGKYILCANHLSAHDIFLAAMGIHRQVFYLAKSEATKIPIIGGIIKKLTIPIHRGASDIAAIKSAISAVNEGKLLGIFPQGTRMPGVEPSPEDAKSGVGLITYRTKASIIPVRIKTKGNKIKLFRRIDVYIGDIIPYDALGFERGGSAEMDRVSKLIFRRICSLGEEDGEKA